MAYDHIRFVIVRDFLNFKKDFRWQEQAPSQFKNEKDRNQQNL